MFANDSAQNSAIINIFPVWFERFWFFNYFLGKKNKKHPMSWTETFKGLENVTNRFSTKFWYRKDFFRFDLLDFVFFFYITLCQWPWPSTLRGSAMSPIDQDRWVLPGDQFLGQSEHENMSCTTVVSVKKNLLYSNLCRLSWPKNRKAAKKAKAAEIQK